MLEDTINELDAELRKADGPKSEVELWHSRKQWPQLSEDSLKGYVERVAVIAWRAEDEAWAERFERNPDAQKKLLAEAKIDQGKHWFQRALTKLAPDLALCEDIAGRARHGAGYERSSKRDVPGVAELCFRRYAINLSPKDDELGLSITQTSGWRCIIVDTDGRIANGSVVDVLQSLRGIEHGLEQAKASEKFTCHYGFSNAKSDAPY